MDMKIFAVFILNIHIKVTSFSFEDCNANNVFIEEIQNTVQSFSLSFFLKQN
jgi:hypothetical protein